MQLLYLWGVHFSLYVLSFAAPRGGLAFGAAIVGAVKTDKTDKTDGPPINPLKKGLFLI